MSDPVPHEIRLIGLSHRTAPLEVREQVAFGQNEYQPALKRILQTSGVHESVLLSTCNRSELVAVVDPAMNGGGIESFNQLLRDKAGAAIDDYLYTYRGIDAVQHLFRVAASLDSMIIGEAQILGQVNEAFDAASSAGGAGPILDRLFDRARTTAKRVRTETAIGHYRVSVASVAVELAEKIFSSLKGRSALVAGLGDTSLLTLQHMEAAGIQRAYVTNRTDSRAVEVGARHGVTPIRFERRFEMMREVDVVISATAAETPIFDRRLVGEVMSHRKGRPIFLIDLAVPRDFDAACASINGVFLYNIDSLNQIVGRNLEERRKEADRGQVIAAEEATRFLDWLSAQRTVPTVVALRRHMTAVQKEEEQKLLSRLDHLSAKDQASIRAYGAGLINKILHEPSIRLKKSGDPRETARLVEAVRKLYYLDDDDEGGNGRDDDRS